MTRAALVMLTGLTIVTCLTLPSRAGAETVVLIADPQLAPGTTPAVAKSLARLVDEGIRGAGARAATPQEATEGARRAGVASLAKRGDSIKAARALGAAAVLRYQALPSADGSKLGLRMAVYFTRHGKAVLLEREVPQAQVPTTTHAMIYELLRGTPPPRSAPTPATTTPATAAPAATATPSAAAAPGPAATPVEAPREPSTSAPAGPTIFTRINPAAATGLYFGAQLGGAAPTGTESASQSFGFRLGALIGYAIRLGRFMSLAPELTFSWIRFANGSTTDQFGAPLELTGSVQLLSWVVGPRYSIYLGPVAVAASLRMGFGHPLASVNTPNSGVPDLTGSGNGFALDFDLGAMWHPTSSFGLGLFLGYGGAFANVDLVEPTTGNTATVSAAGFLFGVALAGKLSR